MFMHNFQKVMTRTSSMIWPTKQQSDHKASE